MRNVLHLADAGWVVGAPPLEALLGDQITCTGALKLTTIDVVGRSKGCPVAQEVARAGRNVIRVTRAAL